MREPRPTQDQLDAALERLDRRRSAAMKRCVLIVGHQSVPLPYIREQLRRWFFEREKLICELRRGWK